MLTCPIQILIPPDRTWLQWTFVVETVRRSEYTLKFAVKKKLNFMSASKPMFLDSHLFFFYFSYDVVESKTQLSWQIWNKALCQVTALPHVQNAYLFISFLLVFVSGINNGRWKRNVKLKYLGTFLTLTIRISYCMIHWIKGELWRSRGYITLKMGVLLLSNLVTK